MFSEEGGKMAVRTEAGEVGDFAQRIPARAKQLGRSVKAENTEHIVGCPVYKLSR